MATQTKDAVTTAVTIVKTKLVSVSVYKGVDGIRYRFNFADSFPAYRRGEDGQNVLAIADYVDFLPKVAIAQLINCLPELADLHVDARERAIRQGVSGGINAAQLQILCRGAEFVIERVQFAAGDPYKTYDGDDAVHEHEGFSTNIKEVKLRPNIEQHDFDVKLKNALRFVEEGNKVKVTIMFRGRELSHPELGKEVLSRVAAALGDAVSIERNAKLEGKNMTMIVAPKVQKSSKKKSQKTQTKGGNSNAEN